MHQAHPPLNAPKNKPHQPWSRSIPHPKQKLTNPIQHPYCDKIYRCITSQPKAGWNTQRHSTRRAGQNMQPTNKSEKLIKYYTSVIIWSALCLAVIANFCLFILAVYHFLFRCQPYYEIQPAHNPVLNQRAIQF